MIPMPPSTGRDQGAAQAYAEELLLRFGDDLDIDDDLDDLEGDHGDDYSDSDLEEDLDDEFGLDDEEEDLDLDEGFGGSCSFPSRVLQAEKARYGKGLLSGIGNTISSAAGFSASAAQGLLASGYNPWAPPPPVIFQAPATPSSLPPSPVSDRETLPPVYVVDPTLAAQAAKAPSISSPSELPPTTKFGASFQEGSVRPRRGQEKEAIIRAQLEGAKELRSSSASSPAPMVEDPTALPFLFADGSIREPIYGALSLLPCPSCHSLSKTRYGANGNGCVVCDDYGAILTPTCDLPNVASVEQFGFVAALLGALAPLAAQGAQIGGQAVGARKQAQAADTSARASRVYARLQQQLEAKNAAISAAKKEEAPSLDASAKEQVSGIGGFLGGLDDLEDLDLPEEFGMDEDTDFGEYEEDGDEDDDLGDAFDDEDDEDDDDDDLDDDLESDDSDLSSEGRIVRILFPRGRF